MVGLGLLVGLAIGLTGMGSGSLLTPLLIISGMPPVTAVGTSISFSFLTKVYGSWKFYSRGFVKMDIVRDLSLGCLPGALLGAFVIRYMDLRRPEILNFVLLRAIGVALIAVSIVMASRALTTSKWPAALDQLSLSCNPHRRLITLLLAFGIGVSMTLTSIGGGAVLIPLIFLAYRIDSSSVVGTDLFIGALLAVIAGTPYVGSGQVDWKAVVGLVCGSIPALWIATHLHGGLPRRIVNGIIAGVLMAMGLHIVVL